MDASQSCVYADGLLMGIFIAQTAKNEKRTVCRMGQVPVRRRSTLYADQASSFYRFTIYNSAEIRHTPVAGRCSLQVWRRVCRVPAIGD
jgi:hypothetical protein